MKVKKGGNCPPLYYKRRYMLKDKDIKKIEETCELMLFYDWSLRVTCENCDYSLTTLHRHINTLLKKNNYDLYLQVQKKLNERRCY